jgi:hypothetical protein
MNDITQIRIGKHMIGIIGLKSALAEADARCKDMTDEQTAELLLEILSRHNYIESGIKGFYAQAFLREYKKHVGEPVPEVTCQGLQVKVLGQGCPQCERLVQEVMAAMSETGIPGEVEHVRNLAEIGRLGVMGLPALVINDEVRAVGAIPPRSKIKDWIVLATASRRAGA